MQEDWSVIHRCENARESSDCALVLHSVGIPYQSFIDELQQHCLRVPIEYGERAKYELWEYFKENQPTTTNQQTFKIDYDRAVPGVMAYIFVIAAVAWMSGKAYFGWDWLGAGRIDGTLIRDGEWWRAITALSLHGSIKHILGNMVFGLLFGLVAGGLLGSGIAWLSIVVAGALGNLLNVLLLDATHRSIGASTAVFAALGLISGFVWRAKLMKQDRWAWRLGPIVGGIALLAYTGTGDANTDVGAHLAGFICGFLGGLLWTKIADVKELAAMQRLAAAFAAALLVGAWATALQSWN